MEAIEPYTHSKMTLTRQSEGEIYADEYMLLRITNVLRVITYYEQKCERKIFGRRTQKETCKAYGKWCCNSTDR